MWRPLEEDRLLDMIDSAEWLMAPPVRAFWDWIKVRPQKWQQSPMGNAGGGFWVVAVIGQKCVYYNDIEGGFNASAFQTFGQIGGYGCGQSDLLSFVVSYHADFAEAVTSAA